MPTNKQRREAARRHLERQLERRAQRENARKRFALVASVMGGVLIIVVVVALVIVFAGSDDTGTKTQAAARNSGSPASSTSPSTGAAANAACPSGSKPVPTATGAGSAVSFHGVTVKNAADINKVPSVGSHASKPPAKLLTKDLVVGKGTAATPTSTVSVKYTGVLYCDGTEFDGPAEHGDKAISFPLTGVVPGFTQGIGGTSTIAPMKVGGRRIIIMPASLGYGSGGQGSIPANAPLVFVVTLEKVS